MESINEKTYYQDSKVLVTQTNFSVGNKTYPLNSISSVSIFKLEDKKTMAIVLVILGGLIALGADSRTIGLAMLMAGFILIIMGKKDFFTLSFNSSGKLKKGIISKDENYVQKIVEAINTAKHHKNCA